MKLEPYMVVCAIAALTVSVVAGTVGLVRHEQQTEIAQRIQRDREQERKFRAHVHDVMCPSYLAFVQHNDIKRIPFWDEYCADVDANGNIALRK